MFPWLLDARDRSILILGRVGDDRFAWDSASDFFVINETLRAVADIGGHAEIMVEAHLEWTGPQRFVPIHDPLSGHAEVPFAEGSRAVALAFAERGQSEAVGFNVQWGIDGK